MRRLLCLSLCLGVVASGCKKKFTQADLDAEFQRGRAAGTVTTGGTGTTGNNNTQGNNQNQVTVKTRDQIIAACMPLIWAALSGRYTDGAYIYFRGNNTAAITLQNPATVVNHGNTAGDWAWTRYNGWGAAGDRQARITALAENADIKAKFVDRAVDANGNAQSGLRVMLSIANPARIERATGGWGANPRVLIAMPAGLTAVGADDVPAAPGADNTGGIAAGQAVPIIAADAGAAWYDCARDTTTQEVSLIVTTTALI